MYYQTLSTAELTIQNNSENVTMQVSKLVPYSRSCTAQQSVGLTTALILCNPAILTANSTDTKYCELILSANLHHGTGLPSHLGCCIRQGFRLLWEMAQQGMQLCG